MFLIDDLIMLPVSGIKFVLRTLAKTAEQEYTDSGPLKQRLLELQEELDNGDITEEDYVRQESQIFRDLREIERRRREMAGVPADQQFP